MSLLCKTATGSMVSAKTIVTNARLMAAVSKIVSYDLPSVSSFSTRNMHSIEHENWNKSNTLDCTI